jgi:hypothetical protein
VLRLGVMTSQALAKRAYAHSGSESKKTKLLKPYGNTMLLHM